MLTEFVAKDLESNADSCLTPFLTAIAGELNQKIHIAGGRVEVICPCCRAKHFQAAYVKALADGGDSGTVLGDGGVHGWILGDGIQTAACAARRLFAGGRAK